MTRIEDSDSADAAAMKILEQDGYALIFSKEHLTIQLLPISCDCHQPIAVQSIDGLAESLLQEHVLACSGQRSPIGREASDDTRLSIDRLTLAITNLCNLGCSYCYASGGAYYSAPGLRMTKETAFNAINQAARTYSRIEHINFFGGEPTLNREIIELVCEYVRYLHDRGNLTHLPTFGITTNGYVLTDRMLEVLTGYHFNVTLSLDGPREVHNLNRPTKAGKGTYDAVSRNAKRLIANGLDVEFECTYTTEHLRRGIDMVGLLDFFAEEYGCRVLHCPIVSAAPHSKEWIPLSTCLQLQGEAIEASILNLARGVPKAVSIAVRMLNSLVNQTPLWTYCPAGRSEVTVNADGNVYACFMLMQSPTYSFGTVNRGRSTDSRQSAREIVESIPGVGSEKGRIEAFIQAADKYANPVCQKCWAQPLCHGCLGEDFERMGDNVYRSDLSGASEFCDYKRRLIERFLRALARAYQIIDSSPSSHASVGGSLS